MIIEAGAPSTEAANKYLREKGRKEGKRGWDGKRKGNRKEGGKRRRRVSFILQKFYHSNLSTEIINLQVNVSH